MNRDLPSHLNVQHGVLIVISLGYYRMLTVEKQILRLKLVKSLHFKETILMGR